MATTIKDNAEYVTMINVFTIAPEHAREYADYMTKHLAETFSRIDGFITANVHLALDGTRVVNYAQWESVEKFEAMKLLPRVAEVLSAPICLLATPDPHLYTVESTIPATA